MKVAGINKSNLPDDVFFSLSLQGQACANKAARSGATERPAFKPSPAQRSALLRALAKEPGGLNESDCRSCDILVAKGLMRRDGAVKASRPTVRFKLTKDGRDLAMNLTEREKYNAG